MGEIQQTPQPNDEVTDDLIALAAHDLNAPLRKLSIFFEKINTAVAEKKDPSLYIERASIALKEMNDYVQRMALYNNIGTNQPSLEMSDTNAIIAGIIGSLDEKYPGKQVNIQCALLPALAMGIQESTLLFTELINNAVTFNDGEHIEIVIDSPGSDQINSTQIPQSIVRIRDNGIGISPDQADRIFLPFIRLNGKSTYPGTGLGLAICRKIVKRHAGIIYAAPCTPFGTSITLILPQTQN